MTAGTYATGCDVTKYDDFLGGELDPKRWRYLTLPYGDRPPWECVELGADTLVGEGTLDIHFPLIAQTHHAVQVFDNLKHILTSTEEFSTTSGGITVTVDMAATSIGEVPTDHRHGFATFMLLDEVTGWSFSACSNGKRVFALHDALRRTYHDHAATHVIDAPSPKIDLLGNSRRHEITIDTATSTLEWRVDGLRVFRVVDPEIPTSLHICLGLATLNSIDRQDGEYISLAAGLSVSFGAVSVGNAESAEQK
jgi:Family of unknown function (DUF6081)